MKPVLQALVIADRIYEDRATGKKIISGTFNTLLFGRKSDVVGEQGESASPKVVRGGMSAGSPYAYISITEVRGKIELTLRYVDLLEATVIFQATVSVESDNPLRTIELVAALPELPIPHAGTFAFEVLCEGELIGSHRINVEQI